MTPVQNPDVRAGAAGVPGLLLRVAGAGLLAAAATSYAQIAAGWGLFALLFFVPDAVMLGYLRGPRLVAILNSAGHSTILTFLVIGRGLMLPDSLGRRSG
jgi:Domain of unknown function (DUF4260)